MEFDEAIVKVYDGKFVVIQGYQDPGTGLYHISQKTRLIIGTQIL